MTQESTLMTLLPAALWRALGTGSGSGEGGFWGRARFESQVRFAADQSCGFRRHLGPLSSQTRTRNTCQAEVFEDD